MGRARAVLVAAALSPKSFFLATILFVVVVPISAGQALSGKIVVLDPGHATINFQRSIVNSGKSKGDAIAEHRLTLEIATALAEALKADGATVYLTRTNQDYWRTGYSAIEDNKARAFFANEVKADALIAIHCDWHPSRKFYGVTTFYSAPSSRQLGEEMQKHLVRDLDTHDRGVVQSHFTVLDHADMPAILVETGFMSNRTEGKKLNQSAYQKRVAAAMAGALRRYFAG